MDSSFSRPRSPFLCVPQLKTVAHCSSLHNPISAFVIACRKLVTRLPHVLYKYSINPSEPHRIRRDR